MRGIFWAFFVAGLILATQSVVAGRRNHHDRGRIIEDAVQAGFVSFLSLVFLLPAGIAQRYALVLLILVALRGLWIARRRG
jgi:hypothetical protein